MRNQTGCFRRSDRLLDSRDFRRVLRTGSRHTHRDLVAITSPVARESKKQSKINMLRNSDRHGSRLGITIGRKAGDAVTRNRFKRRIRAWFRARRQEFPTDWDLVVIARRSGAVLSFDQLDFRLSTLLGIEPRHGSNNQNPLGVPRV